VVKLRNQRHSESVNESRAPDNSFFITLGTEDIEEITDRAPLRQTIEDEDGKVVVQGPKFRIENSLPPSGPKTQREDKESDISNHLAKMDEEIKQEHSNFSQIYSQEGENMKEPVKIEQNESEEDAGE
jgi:hypothetical protein